MDTEMFDLNTECQMVDGTRDQITKAATKLWGTDKWPKSPEFGAVQLRDGRFSIVNVLFLDKWGPPFKAVPEFDTLEEAVLFAQMQNMAYGFN